MDGPSPYTSFSLTHVNYNPDDRVSYLCAWLAIVPQGLCVAYATLIYSTREIEIILMFAGQMACEAVNFILKRIIKEERPKQMHGKGSLFAVKTYSAKGYESLAHPNTVRPKSGAVYSCTDMRRASCRKPDISELPYTKASSCWMCSRVGKCCWLVRHHNYFPEERAAGICPGYSLGTAVSSERLGGGRRPATIWLGEVGREESDVSYTPKYPKDKEAVA
ncbi:hypothetical protein V499_00342 [Pseudogymnoascus sp. VKM F-103]|nr:hypothetical protein V499_00342 [Pseudogymnoascus sp. VKM F-103]